MKHLSLIIFLLGFSLSINAQDTWNKLIGSDDERKAQVMLKSQTEEAYFVVFGEFLFRDDFSIKKYDGNGDIIWENTFDLSAFSLGLYGTIMNNTGNIIIIGTRKITENSSISPFFIIVDGMSGDIIHSNFYTEPENSNLVEIYNIVGDGETYVVKSVVYDSITDSYDSSRFYRLNETGHIIDSTTMPRQFIYSSTGGIFSYGRQLPEEFFTFSVCKHSNTDLSIIENELILDYESRFYDVYPDHEGGIIAITREDSILRLDENLNILWDYPESHFGDLIYPGLEYTLVDFFNMSDGGYMVTTGHWNVFSGTMGMLKLNADGNSEWFADFLNTPITSMHSLHETADGGYMFIAHTDVTFDYPHHSWLVKVNNLGLLLSDENLLSDNDTPRINIFPNPVKNTLNISGKIPDDSKAVIYDYSGRILLMQKMEALENSINVSHLDKGMYILKIFNQNQSYAIRFMK